MAFFKFFYVSSSGSSSLPRPLHGSSHSTRAPDNKNPDGRDADGRTTTAIQTCGGGTKNLELAGLPTDTGLRRVLRRITRFIQSGASEFRPKIMKSPSNSVTDSVLHYCVKSPVFETHFRRSWRPMYSHPAGKGPVTRTARERGNYRTENVI